MASTSPGRQHLALNIWWRTILSRTQWSFSSYNCSNICVKVVVSRGMVMSNSFMHVSFLHSIVHKLLCLNVQACKNVVTERIYVFCDLMAKVVCKVINRRCSTHNQFSMVSFPVGGSFVWVLCCVLGSYLLAILNGKWVRNKSAGLYHPLSFF